MERDASFGHWVYSRRRELHLSRVELAAQVGCAAVTLRKIEEDARRPSPQMAALLAERLLLPPPARAAFMRVARGELLVEHLAAISLASPDSLPAPASAVQRERIPTPLRTNLPAPLTSFVGRDQELAEIAAAVADHRLVTLTGVGGVGKTRLCIEAGIRMVRGRSADIAPDGVWLVELAALAEPTLVAPAIARAFRLHEQPGRSALEQLQEHLADTQLLLILDNCEHLLDGCAAIAEQLLLHCWRLRIFATSRELLRVPGEWAYPVAPLALPALSETRPAQVLAAPAAQLFVARMDAGRAPTDPAEAAAITEICRQLDGIPLALELAAPLAQSLALPEIARQLQDHLAILKNAYRTAIPRHQTMHSALVWSYRLLAPAEQRLLARCAVFAGGWTPEAAQAVCAEGEPVRGRLERLVAASLALREGQGGQARYRLLEPVRQFAQAQLAAGGEEEAAVCGRHAAHFLTLAEQMHRARDTADEGEWLDRLEPERDNLRAANTWLIAAGEAELAQRFNGWLFAFWIYRNSHVESRRWVDAALALRVAQPTRESRLAEALALDTAGYLAVSQRSYGSAEECFKHELDHYTEAEHPPGVAAALRGLGFTALQRGDLDQAEPLTARALAISQEAADHWGIAWALFDLGYMALVRGDLHRAQSLLEQSLPLLKDQGILFGAYRVLIALGHLMRELNDSISAIHYYREALHLQQRMRYTQVVLDVIGALAGIAAGDGHVAWAAVLFGASQAISEVFGFTRWPHLDERYARDLALARSQLDPEQWEAAWERGRAMSLVETVAFALDAPGVL